MKIDNLARSFARMGARALFGPGGLTVRRDARGEHFLLDLETARADRYDALDVCVRRRHLILAQRDGGRFLCGHDERAWFVAAVPGTPCKVEQAMDLLQPADARLSRLRHGVPHSRRHRRHNAGFLRQGEWFFVPTPGFAPAGPAYVRRDEPISRGRGKAHVVEELCRVGGSLLYVREDLPGTLSEADYLRLKREGAHAVVVGRWRQRWSVNAAYARGAVRYPDHATLHLPGWHLVRLSAEAGGGHNFLD
jgi:hypothetical protein